MNEEITDREKIVELAKRRMSPKHGQRKNLPKPGTMTEHKYKRLAHEAMMDAAATQAAELTDAEREFVELIVNGVSQSRAYELTHPDACFIRKNAGEYALDARGDRIPMTGEQIWSRADKLLATPRLRGALRLKLEQEVGDVEHTALWLRNFIDKRYVIEALTADTAAARIAALRELDKKAIAVTKDREQNEALTSPEGVLTEIEAQLTKLGV